MIPQADDATLSAYLRSIHDAIRAETARDGDGNARLAQAADIAARVAQQLDARNNPATSAQQEADGLRSAEAYFSDTQSSQPSPLVAPRAVDAAAIEFFLRDHLLGGPATIVHAATLLSGGRCKTTAQITMTGAHALPESIILRQDWSGGATETSVSGEYALLCALADHGIRVPRPFLLETDETPVGLPFMLMELVPGKLAGGLVNPPQSAGLMMQLAEQIGRMHSISLETVRPLLPDTGQSGCVDRLQTNAQARALHHDIGLQSHLMVAALDWLDAHVDDSGDFACLTHNDLGFHNALVEGDRLTAILDWELASIGHPASDLGYIKHFVDRVVPWDAFLGAYTAAGGFRLDEAEIRFHAIRNSVRLYGLIMQARANLAAGRVNDLEIAHACADNLMPLMAFLASELGL